MSHSGDMLVFAKVIEQGSFAAAAEGLGITSSAISNVNCTQNFIKK
jgi:DNA-binding transcriptional LysR family regulator